MLLVVIAGSSFAAPIYTNSIRGYQYQPDVVTKSIAGTAETLIFATDNIGAYIHKTIIVKGSAAAQPISCEVYASADDTNWYVIDSTSLSPVTAGNVKALNLAAGYPIEYFKITGKIISSGAGTIDATYTATPELLFRGSTN